MKMNLNNKFILLVGPSGSGKTTVAEALERAYGLKSVASYTTRDRRYDGETGHIFVTNEEFDALNGYVAYTEFDGNRYCATSEQVAHNDIYVVDVAGVEYFAEAYHGDKDVVVFYFDIAPCVLRQRMLARGDGALQVAQRIQNDSIMFEDAYNRLSKVYQNVYVLPEATVEDTIKQIFSCLGLEVRYECN